MTNEVILEARRVAKGLGWHPTALPCQCWSCQAHRVLTASADEIDRLQSEWNNAASLGNKLLAEAVQLRGNLSLAEEGLASAMQEIQRLEQREIEARQIMEPMADCDPCIREWLK